MGITVEKTTEDRVPCSECPMRVAGWRVLFVWRLPDQCGHARARDPVTGQPGHTCRAMRWGKAVDGAGVPLRCLGYLPERHAVVIKEG